LFTQSSSVCEPLLQAFLFPSTLGEVTLHPLSQAGVFIYSSCGKWVFPALLWSFLPTAAFTSFSTPDCWVCAAASAYSGPACLFTVLWGISPPPLFGAQGAPPSLLCVFFVVIAYYSVSLFFSGWGSVCPGGYADLAQGCLWKYCIPLSSPCPCLPKLSWHWHLVAAWGSSWFLRLTWSRDAMHRGGVENSKFYLFLVVFPVRCVSSVSPRFYFRRHAFCFLPLAAVLESPLHTSN
jgi:hypothetical protein